MHCSKTRCDIEHAKLCWLNSFFCLPILVYNLALCGVGWTKFWGRVHKKVNVDFWVFFCWTCCICSKKDWKKWGFELSRGRKWFKHGTWMIVMKIRGFPITVSLRNLYPWINLLVSILDKKQLLLDHHKYFRHFTYWRQSCLPCRTWSTQLVIGCW